MPVILPDSRIFEKSTLILCYEKKFLTLYIYPYLNLDISVQGNYSYTAKASPLLHNIIYDVTRKIKLTENETVFDRWLKYGAGDNPSLP